MALIPYALAADVADYMGVDEETLPADIDRMILRATDFLYYATLGVPTLYAETADVDPVLMEACCAQIEYWISDVDEGHERIEPVGSGSINNVTWQKPQAVLAPRARRVLWLNGYLNRHVIAKGSWTARDDLSNFD